MESSALIRPNKAVEVDIEDRMVSPKLPAFEIVQAVNALNNPRRRMNFHVLEDPPSETGQDQVGEPQVHDIAILKRA